MPWTWPWATRFLWSTSSFPHDLPTARLYATDITQRKTAEEALRESERRFLQVVDSLPQLVWTCQPDGPCDFLNKQWIEFTGIPEAEQLGYGWLNQIHPDDRTGLMQAWQASVATGLDLTVEFRIRRHDGVYRWFDTRAVPWVDAQGQIDKWFGTNTDINELRRLEDELKESRELFRQLAENIRDVFFVRDFRENRLLYMSPAYGSWSSSIPDREA